MAWLPIHAAINLRSGSVAIATANSIWRICGFRVLGPINASSADIQVPGPVEEWSGGRGDESAASFASGRLVRRRVGSPCIDRSHKTRANAELYELLCTCKSGTSFRKSVSPCIDACLDELTVGLLGKSR